LRHKAEHLLAELVKAKQAEDVSRATDLLTMATERDKTALALLARADESQSPSRPRGAEAPTARLPPRKVSRPPR